MNSGSENFSNQLIDQTFQKVVHLSDDNYFVDGTGSYINPENFIIIQDFTSSYYQDSASFDYRLVHISGSSGSFVLLTEFNDFTSSYELDSGSWNSTIVNVYASESQYELTSSYQQDSASFDYRINNQTNLFEDFVTPYLSQSVYSCSFNLSNYSIVYVDGVMCYPALYSQSAANAITFINFSLSQNQWVRIFR